MIVSILSYSYRISFVFTFANIFSAFTLHMSSCHVDLSLSHCHVILSYTYTQT